jgi:two-component system nitrate/nitrite response regulator NarL
VKILIADDHPIFCAGLRRLLEVERGFEVLGEARDGVEAVELASVLRPDLVLLDLAMPRMEGLDVIRELTRRAIGSRLVLLTASISRQRIVEALRHGAHGVVMKEAASDLLFRAIRAVMAGQTWVDRETVSDLLHYMRGQSMPEAPRKFRLTPREQQVVAAVVSGLTNKDIAKQFSVSEDTIKHHVSNIFDKLGVSNRLELALVALDTELVDRRQPSTI